MIMIMMHAAELISAEGISHAVQYPSINQARLVLVLVARIVSNVK